jgi:p-hydroxybenzoate 3-monooxygenase
VEFRFGRRPHRIDFRELTGRAITIYAQQEVVKDLVARRLSDGGPLLFDVDGVSVDEIAGPRPRIKFTHEGRAQEIDCDFIAGCDGFHGICRPSFPDGVLSVFERDYPFGWLGILSESPPPADELIYSYTERGFALYAMRSMTLARLYLQCGPGEQIENWPDARIWDELHKRLGGARKLEQGTMLQKGITSMRSFVAEPMQHGRLFLAGDSAHIMPPTGAKGMNLAFADVVYLSRALDAFYKKRRSDLLDGYSATCLCRVWKAQRFSWWMTQIMHRFPDESAFDHRRQLADLDYLTGSEAAATALAEQYVGLPLD